MTTKYILILGILKLFNVVVVALFTYAAPHGVGEAGEDRVTSPHQRISEAAGRRLTAQCPGPGQGCEDLKQPPSLTRPRQAERG